MLAPDPTEEMGVEGDWKDVRMEALRQCGVYKNTTEAVLAFLRDTKIGCIVTKIPPRLGKREVAE